MQFRQAIKARDVIVRQPLENVITDRYSEYLCVRALTSSAAGDIRLCR